MTYFGGVDGAIYCWLPICFFFPRDAVLYQLSLYLFADQAPWLPDLATCYDNYNVPTLHMPNGRAPLPPAFYFKILAMDQASQGNLLEMQNFRYLTTSTKSEYSFLTISSSNLYVLYV